MQKFNFEQDYSREEKTFVIFGAIILIILCLSVFYPIISIVFLAGSLALTLFYRSFIPILIFLPAYLPFQIALNPSADVDLASGRVIILALALIFFSTVFFRKKPWFRLSHLSLAIVFFLVWSSFSFFSADDSGRFIRKMLVFLSIFPIFFIAGVTLKKFSQWQKLFKYWIYSSFLVSAIGFGQFFLQFFIGQEFFFKLWSKVIAPILYGVNAGEAVASNPSWFVSIGGIDFLRAIGTFPDPHMLAFYLGMSLPLQLVFILKKNKKILWLPFFISFLTLILTFSRGSYVGLAGIFLWLIFFFWRAGKNPETAQAIKQISDRIKISRIIIFLIIFGVLTLSITPFRDRFFSIFDFDEGSNQGRLELWHEATDTVFYNPILGVGLGNFSNFIRPESKYREPIYAHNTYLDLATEIGLPGVTAWLIIIIISVRPAFSGQTGEIGRLLFSKQKTNNKQTLLLWNLAVSLSILWFALHCLFETPIFSPQILPLFIFLLAFREKANARLKS